MSQAAHATAVALVPTLRQAPLRAILVQVVSINRQAAKQVAIAVLQVSTKDLLDRDRVMAAPRVSTKGQQVKRVAYRAHWATPVQAAQYLALSSITVRY